MFVSSKTCLQMAGAAGATLLMAAALPALAQTEAAKAPQAAPIAAVNQVVARDAVTGELRAATADEVKALQGKATKSRTLAAQPSLKSHVSGAKGVRLTDEFLNYAVVVRRADGTLETQEFSSKAEAEAAVKSPAPAAKPATAPTE
jgi:hypothetical protein